MIQKSYIKTRKTCKVTFQLPEDEIPSGIEIESLALVGNFNEWDPAAFPMKRNKQGVYRAEIELEPGQEVQFRYLANGEHWFNAWEADAYIPNHYGTENCVVLATEAAE
jgi:hypothetical protein